MTGLEKTEDPEGFIGWLGSTGPSYLLLHLVKYFRMGTTVHRSLTLSKIWNQF